MKRLLLLVWIVLQAIRLPGISSTEVVGFWKTVDSHKGFTTSVIAVYACDQTVYGRVIVSYDEKTGELLETMYDPQKFVEKLSHPQRLLDINIFWNLHLAKNRWKGGRVFDPRSGNTFNCELWVQDEELILRGMVGPFGVNNTFLAAESGDFPTGFVPPPLDTLKPCIPIT